MRKVTDPVDGAVYTLMPGKTHLPDNDTTCALCFRDAIERTTGDHCTAFIGRLGFTCNSSQRDTFAIPVPDTPEGMAEFHSRVAVLHLEK